MIMSKLIFYFGRRLLDFYSHTNVSLAISTNNFN